MCAAQVEAYLCDLEEKTWAGRYETSRLDCGDFSGCVIFSDFIPGYNGSSILRM